MTLNDHFYVKFRHTTFIWRLYPHGFRRQLRENKGRYEYTSGDIRFMRTFAGVPWREGVNPLKDSEVLQSYTARILA